jgi:hypothetical protein
MGTALYVWISLKEHLAQFNSQYVLSTQRNYCHGTATAVDISCQMDKLLKCIIFQLTNKIMCAKTDGAAAMKGINYNIVGK